MTWTLVARKDFEDAVRSRLLWAAIGVFVILMGIIGVSAATNDLQEADATEIIVMFSNLGGQLLVPIVALMIGYMAIVGERQSGSLRVLFGLSYSRWDVLVGKLVSRLGVIVVATLASVLVAVVMAVALFGSVPVGTFLTFVGFTVLLGMAFTAIAVGVSAVASSRMGAMGGAIGSYVLFVMLWHPFVAGVHYLVEGELVGLEGPAWYFFLLRLNPLELYVQLSSSLADQFIWGLIGWQTVVEDVPEEVLADQSALLVSNRVSGDLPWYLSDWMAALVLFCWILVPLAVGYWRFERADLN